MELTQRQQTIINSKLPSGFKIENIPSKPARQVINKQRRSELDTLDIQQNLQPRNSNKRPNRDKRPVQYEAPEPKVKQNDPVVKIWKIFQAYKKMPGVEKFLSATNPDMNPDYNVNTLDNIDLPSIEKKLTNNDYEVSYQFAADMRQALNNSFRYYAHGSDLYHTGLEMSLQFEKIIEGNENLTLSDRNQALTHLNKKVEKLQTQIKELSMNDNFERGPATSIKTQSKVQTQKPLSLQEKRQLGQNIRKLTPGQLRGVLNIVKECTEFDEDELVFDIESLPAKTCRELEVYVKSCLQSQARQAQRKKPNINKINGIMSAHESTSRKLEELDSQLEAITNKSQSEPPLYADNNVNKQDSEDSSSSSDSDEEELPDFPLGLGDMNDDNQLSNFSVSNMWNSFQQERLQTNEDFIDLEKNNDMFR